MKIKITEDQLDKVKEQESYKKMLFKYWDKVGAGITDNMSKLFGFEYHGGLKNQTGVRMSDVQRWLTEYLGVDKAQEIAMEFFDKKVHTIDNCGGYEFDFTIDNVEDDGAQFTVTVTVDDINGEVMLMLVDGTLHKLRAARDSDDYGWEIENEIEDCIYDYISENVEDKTGISFVMDSINYKSDIGV
jgi:hypothetical protein